MWKVFGTQPLCHVHRLVVILTCVIHQVKDEGCYHHHKLFYTVEPPLTATSLQRPGFFVPTMRRSIQFTVIETSLNDHLSTAAS